MTAHQWANHGVIQLTWLLFATTSGLGFAMRTELEYAAVPRSPVRYTTRD